MRSRQQAARSSGKGRLRTQPTIKSKSPGDPLQTKWGSRTKGKLSSKLQSAAVDLNGNVIPAAPVRYRFPGIVLFNHTGAESGGTLLTNWTSSVQQLRKQ